MKNKHPGKPRQHPRKRTALGDALRHAREEAGESLAMFARRLGVRPRTLAGWESDGRAPGALARAALLAHRPRIPGIVGALAGTPTTWSRRAGATRA